MDLNIIVGTFVLGFIVGFISMVSVVYFIGRGAIKKKLGKSLFSNNDVVAESVLSRLKEVRDITERQLDLQSKTDRPQKNALDGKYKNSLMAEIKELEEQKFTLLKSIIDDGFDPTVKTIGLTGELEDVKLSTLLEYRKQAKEEEDRPKAGKQPKKKKDRKGLSVIAGGKEESIVDSLKKDDGPKFTH